METNNEKRLWVAVGASGNEYLYIGEKAPQKLPNGKAWMFDGVVIPLPGGCIRNLTRKFLKFEDNPIELRRVQQTNVLQVRNLKNKVINKLLVEKYGESGRHTGFLKECGKENDRRFIKRFDEMEEIDNEEE